jgi:NADH:ubiquinone oxidoreductase subunit K
MNPVTDIGLTHFLIVSFLLVAAGIATMLTKRNAIGILIGVELVLNAAALNFVAFNRYAWSSDPARADAAAGTPTVVLHNAIHGQMFAIFIIVLAAAEAAVALAIFLNFYNNFSSIDVEAADELKG